VSYFGGSIYLGKYLCLEEISVFLDDYIYSSQMWGAVICTGRQYLNMDFLYLDPIS